MLNHPLTPTLSHKGRRGAPNLPLPLWEREGPIAQRWEGEGLPIDKLVNTGGPA